MFISALFLSGIKDINSVTKNNKPSHFSFTKGADGIIKLNELAAGGTKKHDEFGYEEDWIELYNNTDSTLKLEEGKWFITDNYKTNPCQYALPEIILEPNSYLLVWCDGLNTVENEIHSNFKLSSSGEKPGLFFNDNGTLVTIDSCTFSSLPHSQSFARAADGAENWVINNKPSPGKSNH